MTSGSGLGFGFALKMENGEGRGLPSGLSTDETIRNGLGRDGENART
jgi:hypothetical protein